MFRKVSGMQDILPGIGNIASAGTDAAKIYLVLQLATAGLVGAGVGYGAAKLSAAKQSDINNAKKQYDNARLSQDVNRQYTKLINQKQAADLLKPPKQARILA